MKEMEFNGYDCVVKKTKYVNNDNLALVLLDKVGGDMVAYVTVNGDYKLPEDTALVKDYSENKGMLEAIKKVGLVEEVLGHIPLGHVIAPIVKFNLDDVEEMQLV